MTPKHIEDVFGDGGVFAKAFQGYVKRPGQLELTTAVDEAIASGEPLLGEAPTGTGKSVSYLVPAIYHVTQEATKQALLDRRNPPDPEKATFLGSRRTEEESPRVLVVTAGISLQDQLAHKDLPMLARLLPWRFKHQLAKGRQNYYCLHRAAGTNMIELRDKADQDQWMAIEAWARETASGDLGELPFEVRPSLRPKLSVSAEECHGSHCPHARDCFALRAREEAGSSEVVVTNYHMWLAHLRAAQGDGGTSILPRYDVALLDEVHELDKIARKFLGFRVSAHMLREPLDLLEGNGRLKKEVDREVGDFFGALAEHRRSEGYKARLRDPDIFAYRPLVGKLAQLAEALQGIANAVGEDPELVLEDKEKREQNELRRAASKVKEHAKNIEAACTMADQERQVYFIDMDRSPSGAERPWLCGEPIDPSGLLRALIFNAPEPKEPGEARRKLPVAIAVSATLSTKDDGTPKGISYMASKIGASDARRVVVKSPFNISKQALTIYPRESPDPKAKDYAEQIAPLITRCVRLAKGRTLGLFTSRKTLDVVTAAVRADVGGEYEIMKQGEASRVALVQRFRKEVSSCLFGVKSFWTGVDVPGQSLSCVIIDRIPFDPPDDPLMDALSARNKETFKDHSIPRAAIELRQAFGRLIRSESDRGVVVLLDRRFLSTGWGKMLVQAMPSTGVSSRIDDIGPFLETGKVG